MVILDSDFERLQIIPGAKHGNIQVGCVDCSLQGGQVRIMEQCSVSLDGCTMQDVEISHHANNSLF